MAGSGNKLFKGGALRLFQTLLYALLFLAAAVILGIYSYFLSVLADRKDPISNWKRAVEGISGAAALYLIFATLLTCCFGGIGVLAFIALALDICFAGGMIAIAVMTRSGASSCSGNYVSTPIGNGNPKTGTGFGGGFGEGHGNSNLTYSVHLHTACRLNTAAFAVSIIAALLFLCAAALEVALVRHHKKEKRFGPSPANNYTSGYGKRRGMFGRRNKNVDKDAELGTYGAGAPSSTLAPGGVADTRPSAETGYTGSTVAAPGPAAYDKVDVHHGHAPHGTHGGYYTQPQGTGVNPYGYDNTKNTATNY